MTLTSSDNVEAPGLAADSPDGLPPGPNDAAAASPGPTAASAAAAAVRPGRTSATSRARQVTEQLAPSAPAPRTVVKDERQKLGPNQPCWCNSGKKFKHCHGNRATKSGAPVSDGVQEDTTAS